MKDVRHQARELLLRNVKDGYSRLLGQHYCYIAPSPRTYPFQWFWDTCFHVIVLARLGEYDLAKRNLRSLFAMQEDDGFVGHMIFWNQVLPKRRSDVMQARPTLEALRPHMSALIQPPFAAQALHSLYEACGDRVYLGELYARVRRHHQWLAENRDFDGDGLLSIISPFESGMDWKPSYDPVLGHVSGDTPRRLYTSRLYWKAVGVDLHNFLAGYDLRRIKAHARFRVKDAGINAIYAVDLHCMERLAALAGDDPRSSRAVVAESWKASCGSAISPTRPRSSTCRSPARKSCPYLRRPSSSRSQSKSSIPRSRSASSRRTCRIPMNSPPRCRFHRFRCASRPSFAARRRSSGAGRPGRLPTGFSTTR